MKKSDLEKILTESESVKSAVEHGVPLKDAVKIYLTANQLVEEGKWVQLYANKTVRSKAHSQCTSVVRYWGSEELLSKLEKEPDKFPLDKLKKMYRAGLLGKTVEEISSMGKTHELVLGSEIFPKDENLRPSLPPIGSRVYHRHWEIEEMYRYADRKNSKIILFLLLLFIGLSALFLFFGKSNLTGLAVFDRVTTGSVLVAVAVILSVLILVILTARIFLTREKN